MALDADPYRVLGLSRGASLDEVKRAYRRLAKANHPDAAGANALPRFLAIQAAYERLAGGSTAAPTDHAGDGASRRAEGDRPRESRARAERGTPRASGTSGPSGGLGGSRPGRARREGDTSGASDGGRPGPSGASAGAGAADGDNTQTGAARGKATLGSTSYDGADGGPFEPDWAGASWYGTTSGTYWTINPKEYADPRKHGPEYQARARRAAAARPTAGPGNPTAGRRRDRAGGSTAEPPPATGSTWEPTSRPPPTDPEPEADPEPVRGTPASEPVGSNRSRRPLASQAGRTRDDRPAPDPARAAVDLARALTDPASGGLRGHAMRAVLGWIPAALGLGWLLGELTGCGRFAATCDPAVGPLTAAGQAIVLVVLLLLPEIAAIAAGAALVVLGAAIAASLVLSATGAAADEASRRTALGGLLLVAWLGGLAIALVRRARRGSRTARPVS